MPRGGIVPPAPVLALGRRSGRVPAWPSPPPRLLQCIGDHGHRAMPGLGQPLARRDRKPHLELRARIRRRFQDPRHEEKGRRGVGLGVYNYIIMFSRGVARWLKLRFHSPLIEPDLSGGTPARAFPTATARTTPVPSTSPDLGVLGRETWPHACVLVVGLSIGEKGLHTHPLTLPLKAVKAFGVDLERR
jgi:hypothetical protein